VDQQFLVIDDIQVDFPKFERQFYKKIQSEFFGYIHFIAEWFAYSLLTNFEDQEDPCQWKHSFSFNSYPQLYHFIHAENRRKSPSENKNGFANSETNLENLENLTDIWLTDQLEDFLVEQLSHLPTHQLNRFMVSCRDAFQESKNALSYDLIQKVLIMDSKFLFELGKEQALLQLEKEEFADVIQKEQEEELERNCSLLLKKLQSQYKQTYHESFPLRISLPLYEDKIKPLLVDLLSQGVPLHQIRSLSKYSYWAPSVCNELKKFQ
jgi:hypothetical protein